MSTDILNLDGVDRVDLLLALYHHAKPVGLGKLHYIAETLTREEVIALLARAAQAVGPVPNRGLHIDYLYGRPIKVTFEPEGLRGAWLYNRDHGEGACERIVESLRKKKT